MRRNRASSVDGIAVAIRIAVLISLLSGCGGGGGSGSEQGTGSLTVSVSDALGDPAGNVRVDLFTLARSFKAKTDRNGRVRFARVPAGTASIFVSDPSPSGVSFTGSSGSIEVADGASLDVNVTLRPDGIAFAALRASWAEASAPSADGRAVDVAFDLYSFTNVGTLYLPGCSPDGTDDTPAFRPNCVEGPVAFDAPYEAPGNAERLGAPIAGSAAAPFSVAVLLDQGGTIALKDPDDVRLFAVKHLLSMLHAEDRVLLAAFASDDAAGQRALLPSQPTSTFPDGVSPTFAASDRAELFPIVDSLAALEGGASPLYAAIDKMLDVTAQNTPPAARRSVVVLTTDVDKTCGSATQCLAARQALLDKAVATGTSIVVVGLGSESQPVDVLGLSELAAGAGGALLWTDDPHQLPALARGLLQILDGSAETLAAHRTIQTSTDGAFQTGRSVLGKVTVEFTPCPLDCYAIEVPFAARIR